MAKFSRKGKGGTPAISTSSLPDIIFMLLFFFMVTTVMREVDLKVILKVPEATQIKKLEKKSLVSYIYIGEPREKFQKVFGTEPKIQLNDKFANTSDIRQFVESERAGRDEKEAPLITYSLKVDQECKMGVVSDVKQELREVQALKINYSTKKKAKRINY